MLNMKENDQSGCGVGTPLLFSQIVSCSVIVTAFMLLDVYHY